MKQVLGFIITVAVLGGAGYYLWQSGVGTEVQYIGPLNTLIENTFEPDPESDSADNIRSIKDMGLKCQRRMETGKATAADQYAVEICQTLMSVYGKREAGSPAPAKKTSSLKGSSRKKSSKKVKTMSGSLPKRGAVDYEKAKREYCDELLNKIKQLKDQG